MERKVFFLTGGLLLLAMTICGMAFSDNRTAVGCNNPEEVTAKPSPLKISQTEKHQVTFEVDMRNLPDTSIFNHDADSSDYVYISGDIYPSPWPQPGSLDSARMYDSNNDSIYTISMMLPAGEYQYKYFFVPLEQESSWDYGEWTGFPNRRMVLEKDTVIYDIWGDMPVTDLPIYYIQHTDHEHGDSPWMDKRVRTRGRVTAVNNFGFYMQDSAKAWNGIWVYTEVLPIAGHFYLVNLRDRVEVTGYVDEYYGETEFNLPEEIRILARDEPLPDPLDLHTGVAGQEAYEGVLIKVHNALVSENTIDDQVFWKANDGSGPVNLNESIYDPGYIPGAYYNIRGVIQYAYNTYRIQPRFAWDVEETTDDSTANIIYVDVQAMGSNDGTSWGDAYNLLGEANDAAAPGDQIWVAQGNYIPQYAVDFDGSGDLSSREKTFIIPSGVKIFGGFNGTENTLDERDFRNNKTILSGRVDSSLNAYHVVFFQNVTADTEINGFTIRDGNANGSVFETQVGGGILNSGPGNEGSHPTIKNCAIINNNASRRGGGIFNDGYQGSANAYILNCRIQGNTSNTGGGISIDASGDGFANPLIVNTLIAGNMAVNGGGVSIEVSSGESYPVFVNSTIAANNAEYVGSGVYTAEVNGICSPEFKNSIIWGNLPEDNIFNDNSVPLFVHSIVYGSGGSSMWNADFGDDGGNNLDEQPQFVSLADYTNAPSVEGNYHLASGSPAINSGNNAFVPQEVVFDLQGNERIKDGDVDMGVYETEGGGIQLNASFSASPVSGAPPLVVDFFDESSGDISDWHWDFGDGTSSSMQNPSHEYKAGTYTVTLTVTGSAGSDTVTRESYIVVTDDLIADFSSDVTSGSVPLTVQFFDASVGEVFEWSWDFGDGAVSEEQNPVHEYTEAGIYTVSLAVVGSSGEDYVLKEGYIVVAAGIQPDFSADVTSGSSPLTVQFFDESVGDISEWFWQFGDGASSYEQNPVHEYTGEGSYSVSLTVTGDVYSDTISKQDYIQVTCAIEPDFSADVTSGSSPLTVQFYDETPGEVEAWNWNFGDGTFSDERNPTHKYTEPGLYTVSLSVRDVDDCSGSRTKTNFIEVNEKPFPFFTANTRTGNAPLTVSFRDETQAQINAWNWDLNGDGADEAYMQEVSHTYKQGGTYDVTLTVLISGERHTTTMEDYISVYPLTAITGSNAGKFNLYPNPASGKVYMQIPGNTSKIIACRIISLTGKTVLQNAMPNNAQNSLEMDVGGLSEGIYLLELTTGKKVYTEKLVIE